MMDELERRVRELDLPFKLAKRRYHLAPGAFGKLAEVAYKYAQETGEPRAACVTRACAAYWRIYDERSG